MVNGRNKRTEDASVIAEDIHWGIQTAVDTTQGSAVATLKGI